MTLTEKHAQVVRLERELIAAQRLASDAAVGEADVPFETAFHAVRKATVNLLTALAVLTPAELKQGPARDVLLRHVAAR